VIKYGPFPVAVASGLEFTMDGSRSAPVIPRVGSLAPNFRLASTGNEMVQLSLLRGQPVVLSFFCRCGLCHAVAKEMARTPQLAERARIYAIFGDYTIGQPPDEKEFRQSTGFEAPFLIDLSSEVGLQYDSTHCPRVWLIDKNGIVRYVNASQTAPPEQIVADVLKALGTAG
jgi:peroxiredoxin